MNIIEVKSNLTQFNVYQPIELSPDENNISITLTTLTKSARVLGKQLNVSLN